MTMVQTSALDGVFVNVSDRAPGGADYTLTVVGSTSAADLTAQDAAYLVEGLLSLGVRLTPRAKALLRNSGDTL